MRCGAWYTDLDTLTNIEPTLAGIKRTRIFQVHRRTHRKLELQSSKAQFTCITFDLCTHRASFYVLLKLQYPLRLIWITPSTTIFPEIPDNNAERRFYPLSAYLLRSRFCGLTPAQFWKHKQTLLRANLVYLISAGHAPPTLKDYSRVRVDALYLGCSHYSTSATPASDFTACLAAPHPRWSPYSAFATHQRLHSLHEISLVKIGQSLQFNYAHDSDERFPTLPPSPKGGRAKNGVETINMHPKTTLRRPSATVMLSYAKHNEYSALKVRTRAAGLGSNDVNIARRAGAMIKLAVSPDITNVDGAGSDLNIKIRGGTLTYSIADNSQKSSKIHAPKRKNFLLRRVRMRLENMTVARRFARERSAALVAEVFHLQVHFLDMSNNALPFHGGSSTVAPCT
ncbi:hypothetical protein EV424DRAFT_1343689 [Suillus variegatus]|nr:hypothetical protein EV424DRAFT_1343689 [Suillus variegatus]